MPIDVEQAALAVIFGLGIVIFVYGVFRVAQIVRFYLKRYEDDPY